MKFHFCEEVNTRLLYVKSYFPHMFTPGVRLFRYFWFCLVARSVASLSPSFLAHDKMVAPMFFLAHCCSGNVFGTHTRFRPPSSPTFLQGAGEKSGFPQAAHLSQFVLTVAQKPSPTAASRRPPAQWVLATTGRDHRAALQRLHLNLRCHERSLEETTKVRPPPQLLIPAEPPCYVVLGPQPPDGNAVPVTPTRTPLGLHNFTCLSHRQP